jgi:hypothetical protein
LRDSNISVSLYYRDHNTNEYTQKLFLPPLYNEQHNTNWDVGIMSPAGIIETNVMVEKVVKAKKYYKKYRKLIIYLSNRRS